jgi:hypothetical protein
MISPLKKLFASSLFYDQLHYISDASNMILQKGFHPRESYNNLILQTLCDHGSTDCRACGERILGHNGF